MDAKLYSGAYYMCGYVVECALKACICKNTKQFDFFVSPEKARGAWSHDFDKLMKAAGLESEFSAARAADTQLDLNWKSVENWSPDSRYEQQDQQTAGELLAAVSDPDHGVLSCIRQLW